MQIKIPLSVSSTFRLLLMHLTRTDRQVYKIIDALIWAIFIHTLSIT